jgi:Protein of unknown function (DUF3048) N-terminal domain/Protein of unknown function (DUF3048) C-terminal domain
MGVVVIAAALVAGCAHSGAAPVSVKGRVASRSTTTAPPTTTTLNYPGVFDHSYVVVKMDNSPQARPQTGINQADVVFELLVEGITRYALVFGSNTPDRIGPVRSARSSDIDLVAGLGRPLLAWSGANPTVTRQVHAAAQAGLLVDANGGANPPEYWRDNSRAAPHNLYTSLPLLLGRFGGNGQPHQPIFAFDPSGIAAVAKGTSVPGLAIDFGQGVNVDYAWDQARNGWDRFQVDSLHDDANSATVDDAGVQVSPRNVVVLFVHYGTSVADVRSPQAYTTGTGTGIVFSGGRQLAVNWSRAANTAPFTLTGADGQPLALPPGPTWVALPEVASAVGPLDAAKATDLETHRRP